MVILNSIDPHSMSEGTLVLVNPPSNKKKVKRNMATKRTSKGKSTRKAVRRGSTKASRSAAAKKAAATRKRNAAKRSAAGKKAAATRKRNAAKRSTAAKKAASTRKRKTSRKSTTKRGPSKAKRSAAAKKGWRTRRSASTKRSNAAKRAARSRKSTTKRTVKRKTPAKKGRMTKAKRSAAAKKGWRTRRSGGSKRRVTKRASRRKASRRSAKTFGVMDVVPNKFAPVKGAMAGANDLMDSLSMKSVNGLVGMTKGAAAGLGMMGLLAVAKGNIWDKVGLTDMVASVASGMPGEQDLVSAFDAMLDLATVGAIGVALDKGLGTNKKLIAAGTAGASLLIAMDFLTSIQTFGIGDSAKGISQGDIPGAGLISSLNPFSGAHNLGSLGMSSQTMFGTHNNMGMAHGNNMGMAHGNNNLALAMSPNNTAATGNAKFFGTKSLGSTRVNLF